MKLRLRLAVAVAIVAASTIVALQWIDLRHRQDEGAERLIANVERLLANPDERARCEGAPAVWAPPRQWELRAPPHLRPPPGPNGREGPTPAPVLDPQLGPFDLFVLGSDLRPARADGPELDRRLMSALAGSDAIALPPGRSNDDVAVVVKTPWRGGPCAYVYARGHVRRITHKFQPWTLWLPLAGAMGAVLFTMGSVVRRIRRLSDAVTASAATGFVGAIPVEGQDEIAGLARSFVQASRAVRAQLSATEQREATLRDFLANTTHDVMTPLTVLQMHLAAMQAEGPAGKPGSGAILTSAMNEAHYLGALIQNLAAVAKLDSGVWQPVISPVDMNALVHRVVSRHQAIARRLDIAVEFAVPEDPITIDGDMTLLEQGVSNVVYNAVRHNRAGGHVAVILEAAPGNRFSLRVVDDGPGVPAAELTRLVERGFRGNAARTRSPDGLGLGLNISLRIAALHHLDLRFGPSEYGGLKVDLEGPVGSPTLAEGPGPPAPR